MLVGLGALPAHAHDDAGAVVRFADCTEFVGVSSVDVVAARALVPAAYTLVSDAAGAKLVVRVADCAAVRVGPGRALPGRVAQIGLMIVSPDGTATDPATAINNYTLSYATNAPALALALRAAGVPAELDPGLAYEVLPQGSGQELYAAVAPAGTGPRWTLWGSVQTPGWTQPFLANWWVAGPRGVVKMSTDIPQIAFDFSSVVSFYSGRQGALAPLLPSSRVPGFGLSFRGAFPAARMAVTLPR
jgi:hypothetical protein